MSLEVKLPDLGDNISSGTVVSIFVAEGDSVIAEQGLLELETDKAVIEVPSPQAGKVIKLLVKDGDEVKVGQAIMLFDGAEVIAPEQKPTVEGPSIVEAINEQASAMPKAISETIPATTQSSGTLDFKIPNMGDNVSSGSVTSILVKVGDSIEVDQGLVELETDKAVIEVPSDVKGMVKEIVIKEGDTVIVGQKIMTVEAVNILPMKEIPVTASETKQPEPEKMPVPQPAQIAQVPQTKKISVASISKIIPASPSIRRFAREIGINIQEVPGTGPGGRISVEDIKVYSKSLHQQGVVGIPGKTAIAAIPLPDFSKYGAIEAEPLNKLRQTSARNLTYAWTSIPHVTQMDKADITDLERLRKANSKKAETAGGKLTMTAILVKVIEAALQKFPEFNASIDMANSQIIYKKYFNIGIAVDTDRGLLVPVIKNVEMKNIIQLAVELTEIAQKSRDKKLTMDEMQGGNFTISNLGGIGGTGFTPIVNSPDVAILGVSHAEMQPVYIDGDFKPRLMMPLSLSYDHRVIDGAAAARFLRWVCEVLEEPFNVLLEG